VCGQFLLEVLIGAGVGAVEGGWCGGDVLVAHGEGLVCSLSGD